MHQRLGLLQNKNNNNRQLNLKLFLLAYENQKSYFAFKFAFFLVVASKSLNTKSIFILFLLSMIIFFQPRSRNQSNIAQKTIALIVLV